MAPTSNLNKQQLIQRITKTISQCFEGPHIEDSVQLQIVKCLLTILTSPHIEVHEQTMLLAVKTCYNIQITSSSLINQASARAALTQIINTILFRLETSVRKNFRKNFFSTIKILHATI
jgi:brefeldin A-inhibited guanine nucleotide-exchange protein